MIDRNDCVDAITKCVGYDPIHAPNPTPIILDAWEEHFMGYPSFTRDQLLRAVTAYYRTADRKWPQPANLSDIIRADINRHVAPADREVPQIMPSPIENAATAEQRARHLAEIRKFIKNGFGPAEDMDA
jgi:hypothetical protein